MYMHVCMCVCTYIYIYIYTHTYIHTHSQDRLGSKRLRAAFAYDAGSGGPSSTTRPWEHFEGRWAAIRRSLERAFGAGSGGKPFRLLDVGSNNGFFSLQALVTSR